MDSHCRTFLKGESAIILSKERGIKISTFRNFGIGFNPLTNYYTVPVPDGTNTKLWDLRVWKKGIGMRSTTGCDVGLYGWELLTDDIHTVWLCEGEWDRFAMYEIIIENNLQRELALSVPGAMTFKDEWVVLLKGKKVIVVYDNDYPRKLKNGTEVIGSGIAGGIKVCNKLKPVAKDMRFVNWPDSYPDGFDLRDLYFKEEHDCNKTLRSLYALFKDTPKNFGGKGAVINTQVPEKLKGGGLTPDKVYTGFQKWLYIPDTMVLDILFGTIIANRLQGEPIWLFLVAPPAGMKSALLMTLSDAPKIVTATSLTPHSLISGANFAGGSDPSLIPRLNNKILVIKDFTTILNMNQMARDEIIGILRDAYDGKTEKNFGNGVFRSYKSKFGVIAGVTPAIELYAEEHSALGERFLRFKIFLADEYEVLKRAARNVMSEIDMRKELSEITATTLDCEFEHIPDIPQEIINRILRLSQWTAAVRGTVVRDKYSKDITQLPYAEYGSRLVQQNMKLLTGIAQFKRLEIAGKEEYEAIKKVATDTVPSRMEGLVRCMYTHSKEGTFTLDNISEMIGLPIATCGRIAQNLAMLKILRGVKINYSRTDYTFTPTMLSIMEEAELYT
jgi:hypothetical protein